MDWLIWVIVIVLVVAIVWWLTSRNNARNSAPAANGSGTGTPGQPGTTPPAAMEPSNVSTMPDTAAAVSGVAGIAGVTNLGKAAAEGSGPTEPVAEEEPDSASAADTGAGTDTVPAGPSGAARVDSTPETGQTVPNEPVVETPVLDEPVVDEPVVDTHATVATADAGDVDDWQSGPTADDVARADDATVKDTAGEDAADKDEWESSWTDAAGAPLHHHEYTDPHSPTLPGAETAAAEESDQPLASASGHLAADHPYGVGSAGAAADGTGPEGYPVKGDATTMTYHEEDAASYAEAPADVWFESAAHAEAAGFRAPRRNRH
ncbi:hypothetical protein ACIPY3_04115 [Paenarthrobacter sp. NPDC089714]|uniref:sunset domain-containing protein n=1 Tax=Paenarthrobacter sp. NPDC089714 TaxID=3364377 RepID=UPI003806A101